MSLPIKPTPTLSGEDMYLFLKNHYTVQKVSSEERERIRKDAEEAMKHMDFKW